MRFEVTFVDGVFRFVVQSTDPEYPYYETFEILDVNEAKDTAWDLVDEISSNVEEGFDEFDDEDFDE